MPRQTSDVQSRLIVACFKKMGRTHRRRFIAFVKATVEDATLRDQLADSLQELDTALAASRLDGSPLR